jgi:hypothetical protein
MKDVVDSSPAPDAPAQPSETTLGSVSYASGAGPRRVFRELGLQTRGSWRTADAPRYRELSRGARFRVGLEKLGGLYGAFGQFLCWRADLASIEFLSGLRQGSWRTAPIPKDQFVQALSVALGGKGELLARDLEDTPCWSTLSRCAYRSRYQDRIVVVQQARQPVADTDFSSFERGLGALDEEGVRQATTPEVFRQFRQWVRLADSHDRERSYLETLSGMAERTLAAYPRLIPELSTGDLLCWEWAEGEPVSSLLARRSEEAVQKVAEAVLEQVCLLSVVDGEFDPDSMVITPSGRLAVRRANRLIAVPAPLVRSTLRYISAVLAGNSPVAVHLLLKLAGCRSPSATESRLLDELAHLQPELKVNLRFPSSAAVFEGNWRALSRVRAERPLFFDFLHRNLLAVGYWNAETSGTAGPSPDCIAEAQWPILARLLRIRFGELLRRDAASEWFLGSGLLFFEGLRQMNRLADEFRDNDLSIGVETTGRAPEESRNRNRAVRSGILGAMLLVVFLVCLRWGGAVPSPWSTVLAVAAVLMALGLFWVVSRTG